MQVEILTIQDIASLYKTTDGAIRTAVWRARKYGSDPGIPMPSLIRGQYRWLKSAVMADLQQRLLKTKSSVHLNRNLAPSASRSAARDVAA